MGKYKNQQEIKVLQKLLTKFHKDLCIKKHVLSKTSGNMTTNRNKSQKK